jgi:hypothetical protein
MRNCGRRRSLVGCSLCSADVTPPHCSYGPTATLSPSIDFPVASPGSDCRGRHQTGCPVPARPRKQDQRLCKGHQHQVHQPSAHLGIRDPLYSDRKPVRRSAAAAWPVRTAAAGVPGDDRRADKLGGAADVIPNGLSVVGTQKRSSEVWQLLGSIKTEFDRYGTVVNTLSRQLTTASNSVENLGRRTRAMSRKLKGVETLSHDKTVENLLGFSADDLLEACDDRGVMAEESALT